MKQRLLWIEDEAFGQLAWFAGPIYSALEHDLTIELNTSSAYRRICEEEFDAVVVDIRLAPGDDMRWVKLYRSSGFKRAEARLGLHLLYSLLRPEESEIELPHVPPWVTANRFGVMTVEGEREIAVDLSVLGINHYVQKQAGTDWTALRDLFAEILRGVAH